MTDTTFVDKSPATPIVAAWLNDVNDTVYRALGDAGVAPTTAAQVLANLGLSNQGTPSGASLIGFDGGTLATSFLSKVNRVVGSIAALRMLSEAVYTVAFVSGYYTPHDGGGGAYQLDSADTTTADNGGTVIVAADGGRWKLSVTTSLSVKQWGAKGDSTNDDTAPINAALAFGGNIFVPAGEYKLTGPLLWAKDNTWLQGAGSASSILNFTVAGTSCLLSSTQGVSERSFCRASDLQFLDNAGHGFIIDLKDMMFCHTERCFTFGFGAGGSTGVGMSSSNTTLQCTYNRIQDHISGNVTFGIRLTDGANANIIDGGRFQSPLANAIGILLAPTGPLLVNGNTIIAPGIEQPGNTMDGIVLNGNTGGTTIIGPRLEALATGILIQTTDTGVTIVNPLFSDCTVEFNDLSGAAILLFNGIVEGLTQPPVQFNFNGTTSAVNKAVGCSIVKSAVGIYQLTITKAVFASGVGSWASSCSTGPIVIQPAGANVFNIFTYNPTGTVATDAIISGAWWP